MAASVHKYWTQSLEKAAEEATVCELLQLDEMNLAREFVLAKELFGAIGSFDAEEAKSKKLSEDLKAMSLKKARDQNRAVEASQKRVEEAQKLVKDWTLVVETTLATANRNLEAAVVEKKKSLTTAKQELERVRAEQTDVEAKVVEVYQDVFLDTPEYQDLAQQLMTIGGEQLVEWIMETHPEYLGDGIPTSTGIIASPPYAMAKGVSPVTVREVVR
ncbi:hypothetical protein Adt_18803 [Abeliophyllum distichum]|uniref:Uncharacterized protein n=1 Tax=Abeliophyllum distichum TaxID=126358 RepID=A0ABD1TKR9_9LAMI